MIAALLLATRLLVAPADTGLRRDLPLVEVPASRAPATPGPRTLAVLITGDGDWAALDQAVARTLADGGVPVVGLKARAYLTHQPRTPDEMAADVAQIARTYLARWGAERIAFVGYSRGADLLPFVATRLPPDLRKRVAIVAMFGLSTRASFVFHWSDVVHDVARPTDVLTVPELQRLRGMRLLCVYGVEETDSGCRDADAALMTRVAREGKHHFDGDFAGLGRLVLDAIAGR